MKAKKGTKRKRESKEERARGEFRSIFLGAREIEYIAREGQRKS